MHRLIDFSLDNRLLVLAAWLLVVVAGIRSLGRLPIDAVPDVTNVQVQVLTTVPSLAPEEVERFITFPVETAMSGLPRLEEIRSVSKFGLSVVTVVFAEGTDIYWARQLVGERLVAAREEIPAGYGEPEMGPISTGLGEIYQFEVKAENPCGDAPDTAECYTPMELREVLDWFVNYQLRSVPGVVEVNASGGELKTYQVTLDPARLAAYSLTVGDVVEALERNNRNVGGAYITHAGEQYLVRGEGLIETLADLAQVVVATGRDGTPIYIRDLGRVELAPMVRQGAATRDGRGEAVVGIVMMLLGENSRTVTQEVKAKIEQIRPGLPPGVTIDTLRPHRAGEPHHPHGGEEPHRGRGAGGPRLAAAPRQPARRAHRRLRHSPLHARRLHRHALGRPLRQPHVPRGDRLRSHRRRLGGDDREHPPPAPRAA
jgi:cobalt-zinc-cadmium resistance protein CzcA